jgi:hypothetical protein
MMNAINMLEGTVRSVVQKAVVPGAPGEAPTEIEPPFHTISSSGSFYARISGGIGGAIGGSMGGVLGGSIGGVIGGTIIWVIVWAIIGAVIGELIGILGGAFVEMNSGVPAQEMTRKIPKTAIAEALVGVVSSMVIGVVIGLPVGLLIGLIVGVLSFL